MSKKLTIDFSEDHLLNMATDMIDDHNCIGALKMLNKNSEMNFNSDISLELYAEVYDDMSLYEKSVNCWFLYLDYAHDNHITELDDVLEGLSVCYMNMGDDSTAAYYYNKLLIETEDMSPESRKEMVDSFFKREQPSMRITWPPKNADYSVEIQKGIDYMREAKFDEAIEMFNEVKEGNDRYEVARNYIAMSYIISDRYEEAEAECLSILSREPNNVQALTTLSAVKTEQKKTSESKALAEKLIGLKITNSEDLLKVATVCCENKMHDEAYRLFVRLQEDIPYDCNVLYFTAITAWNSKRFEECFEAFDKILTIYPRAFTARYYCDLVHDKWRNNEFEELEYFYRLPQTDREDMLSYLAAYAALPQRAAKKTEHIENVAQCVDWAFDEGDQREMPELQYLAATCAVKANLDGAVRSILLDAFLPDTLKVHTLSEICMTDSDESYGVVLCNIYRNITCLPLKVGRAKRNNFKQAYSHLFARFGIVNQSYVPLFRIVTQELYEEMAQTDRLKLSDDIHALTSAIFYRTGIDDLGVDRKTIYTFFGADREKFLQILGEKA